MYQKKVLYLIGGFLLLEAVLIVCLHSRAPRSIRLLTAGINVVAAIALWALSRNRD